MGDAREQPQLPPLPSLLASHTELTRGGGGCPYSPHLCENRPSVSPGSPSVRAPGEGGEDARGVSALSPLAAAHWVPQTQQGKHGRREPGPEKGRGPGSHSVVRTGPSAIRPPPGVTAQSGRAHPPPTWGHTARSGRARLPAAPNLGSHRAVRMGPCSPPAPLL